MNKEQLIEKWMWEFNRIKQENNYDQILAELPAFPHKHNKEDIKRLINYTHESRSKSI